MGRKPVLYGAMLFAAWLVAIGCGTKPQEKTKNETPAEKKQSKPEDTFYAFQDAVKNDEFEKIYDLLSSEGRKESDGQAKQMKEQMVKNPPKPADVEKMKQYGFSKEKMEQLSGKDMMRMSLAMGQMMADAFAPKDKPKPDIFKEMKEDIAKTKLISATVNKDGKTATMTVQNAKGKTEKSLLVLEDGSWKLSKEKQKEPEQGK